MEFYNNFNELVGHTPILKLNHIKQNNQLAADIYAKLEYYNPAGSIKDRVAKQMIEDAIKDGKIKEDATIIEPTSGNTGIGLCAAGATLGFKVIIVMPDTMSEERRTIMKAFGAELVLSPGSKGMTGAIEKAQELAKQIPNSFIPGQFVTPSNARAHKLSTGPEIDRQLDGQIDILVAGVGTGGTITGVGQYLKEKYPHVQVIAVEPTDSAILSSGKAGAHKLQGIGAGFIPDVLDTSIYDEIILIKTDEAYEAARELAKTEGILVGISSGAALYAAKIVAKRSENKNKNIVVILPDGGDRYLSTDLFK